MDGWIGWPLERFFYIFLGLAFLLVWGQVTLLHWAAGFRSIFMWGPVLYTPVLVLAALLLALTRAPWAELTFVVVFAIGVLEGAFGTYKHFHGVAEQVGGFNLRNFMAGPPVLLPIIYMALAATGLLVYYWDALIPAAQAGQ